ncbi:MAG TPA: response regulator [Methylomirabilota bacterium]|jgi:CheY-like chemotaxis protein|nr:response regulator [Methylomirabilota bacterium]
MTAPLVGRTVLVVDDDTASRETLTAILEFQGAVVLEARAGDEALSRLGIIVPDLVITDIRMPRTSGIELLRAVRGHANQLVATVPMIGITGFADLVDAMWEAGFDDVLLKPIRVERVKDAVVRQLTS